MGHDLDDEELKATRKMNKINFFKNGKIPECFIYTIDGKVVKKEEFIEYVIKMCKDNENHIPHID